jgi:hypothetical protein
MEQSPFEMLILHSDSQGITPKVHNRPHYWVSGLCPSFGILKTENVPKTGFLEYQTMGKVQKLKSRLQYTIVRTF